MTLQQIYEKGMDMAIKYGPRSKKDVDEQLKKLHEQYEKMEKDEKEYFDMESLKNPYLDSRILCGDPKTELRRVLVGIDIGVGEVLLANELSKSGKKIDAIIAHHPEGRALIDLTQVMTTQIEQAVEDGVPVNVIEKQIGGRIGDLNRALHPTNHFQVPQAAELLGIPMACFHTFADNLVYRFMKKYISGKKPKYIKDIIDALMKLPEYQHAKKQGNGPMLFTGDEKSRCGKISYSGFTGGTSGNKETIKKMAAAGVGTVLAMHIPEDHRKLAEKHQMNVVICGHMASDSLGVNLLMDELEKKKVQIVACSGFIRVSRAKKKRLI
ncbi:Nif3-like dinuclear metal center hexameric protein [Patescibacteria group bacterium]|nr:Nif3-like dinuclear metal center hexameric protein [Patescibacteria group bacterium]MBU1703042.1 Nif3-like dinuclear metal center hexameric protein [Patescibacteria group bacterium]MBU1954185.1 Nif3-like dinuclear metal center hexameric protein [Patescibacteria group bacterium]